MMTYAEFVFSKLKNKNVEVYQGNSNIERNYSEYNHQVKTVIIGKLVEANGDCLVIEGSDQSLIFINAYNVHGITEFKENITIDSFYTDVEKSKKLKLGLK